MKREVPREPETVGDILDQLPEPRAVQTYEPRPSGSASLMRLIERAAISPEFDVAKLEKLMDMKERYDANEARMAFVAALNDFKAAPPTVVKNKQADYGNAKTKYDYATLDQVCGCIVPALSEHGLSHRWETNQAEGMIRVTCILTHALGHSERVTLAAGADQSGSKNNIQSIGSTVTYLSRYTLLAVTGLAAGGEDDDGFGAGNHRAPTQTNGHADSGFITAEQKDTLIGLIRETGADTKKFLAYFRVPSLDKLPPAKFASAKAALEKKRGAH